MIDYPRDPGAPGDVASEYVKHVTRGNPSCAFALLALWERPWSSTALRFAAHALQRAYTRGLDVLEAGDLEPKPINAIERTW
jgi:hypothetical protein